VSFTVDSRLVIVFIILVPLFVLVIHLFVVVVVVDGLDFRILHFLVAPVSVAPFAVRRRRVSVILHVLGRRRWRWGGLACGRVLPGGLVVDVLHRNAADGQHLPTSTYVMVRAGTVTGLVIVDPDPICPGTVDDGAVVVS